MERAPKRQLSCQHAASGEIGLARPSGRIDVGLRPVHARSRRARCWSAFSHPECPPVVFVTASQDSKIAVTALKAGAVDYLVMMTWAISCRCSVAVSALRQALIRKARRRRSRGARSRDLRCTCRRARVLRGSQHRSATVCRSSPRCHLQANSSSQEDVKAALTNNGPGRQWRRCTAVLHLHDLNSVPLNQYLEALEDLRRSTEGNRMSRLTLKAVPVEIDPDRAVAIGIIVNELVMNAVKYAYPDGGGPIHVVLNARDDDLELEISDDGVGLNVKLDPRSTGMGQRIVNAMASKLEAEVERDASHSGTRIVLRFRRRNAPAATVATATS